MRAMLNTLSARLLIGSAIPLVLFVAVVVVAGVFVTRMVLALRMEKHTLEVIRQAHALEQHLGDIGHAVASDAPRLLKNPLYVSGVHRFRRTAEDLRRKIGDNEAQRKRLDGALDRLEAFDKGVRSPPPGWVVPPAEVVAMQQDIQSFIDSEEGLLKERHAQAEAQARQVLPIIAAAVLLALALSLLLALTAARSVNGPVARLRESAGRLLTGEYKSVPVEGPTEVAELIVLFNHMALTLTQKTGVLARQEERYRTYVGAVANILWTCDAAGLVVGDLPGWRGYTGQSEDEVKGYGWLDAAHPEDRDRARAAWLGAVEKKEIYEIECRLRGKGGDYRPFQCRGVPVFNSDGSVREWIGTCTDVTEIKERAALEQARDAAEAASRAKSEFLTRMSHELRTPLNAVIGMSRMLTAQVFGALNAKQADYVADISRAGEHLLALINDILDLAKVEAGKMEVQADRFSLAEAVETLASTLRQLAAAKGVRVELRPPPQDGPLETDPARA